MTSAIHTTVYIFFALLLVLDQSPHHGTVASRLIETDGKGKSGTTVTDSGRDDVKMTPENVAVVKSVLLNVLGLKAEPVRGESPRSKAAVPEFMWRMYRRQLAANKRHRYGQSTDDGGADDTDGLNSILHSRKWSDGDTARTAYTGNTIRSFIAMTRNDDVNDGVMTGVMTDGPRPRRHHHGDGRHNRNHHDRAASVDRGVHVTFNVSGSLPSDDVLYGAELRLYKHSKQLPPIGQPTGRHRYRRDAANTGNSSSTPEALPRRYRISVYQVVSDPTLSLSQRQRQRGAAAADDVVKRLLDTKIVDTFATASHRRRRRQVDGGNGDDASLISDNDWVSLDVSPAVATWKQFGPRTNHGLVVEVTTIDGVPIDIDRHVRVRRSIPDADAVVNHDDELHQQPRLVTYTDDKRSAETRSSATTTKSKRKRSTGDRKHRRTSPRPPSCRRRQLYVDFAEVEWNDWIVAPPGYQAYICMGTCPVILPDHLNATNHAQVQSLLHSIDKRVPAPCCVPTELSPISLLYFDDSGTVVLRNYQEMVVEACGCR